MLDALFDTTWKSKRKWYTECELIELEFDIADGDVIEEIMVELDLCARSCFVCGKENVFLEANDFTRDEIKLGIENVANSFGLSGIAKIFLIE